MKKPYQRPAIYAESFQLCEHIGMSCPGIMPGSALHQDANNCTFKDVGGFTLFTQSTPMCEDAVNTGVENAMYENMVDGVVSECYNGFNGYAAAFAS